MPLTDLTCRSAKPAEKPYKKSDGGGLFLLVEKSGSRLWRLAYRFDGKQKLLALGAYPEVSLADARQARDANKTLLAKGIDPSVQRKLDREAGRTTRGNTFRLVADELMTKAEAEGEAPRTLKKKRWLMGLLTGEIGDRPVSEVTAPELLAALRKAERRGRYETAKRLRSLAGQVFRYAISTSRAERNPASDVAGALITQPETHRAAITDPKGVGALMRAIEAMDDGQPTTRAALRLIALTFVRPGELRHAKWSEFDLDGAVWNIPKERMKMRRQHAVPLSCQALAVLREIYEITGSSAYVFPQIRSWHRPMSDGTLNAALRRLGYDKTEMTPHGFRSIASTLLNETRKWHPDVIELQLAHVDKNKVRAAYNRAELWDERVKMMTWWGDHLDMLRDGAKVLKFPA